MIASDLMDSSDLSSAMTSSNTSNASTSPAASLGELSIYDCYLSVLAANGLNSRLDGTFQQLYAGATPFISTAKLIEQAEKPKSKFLCHIKL
jgi:hypothetical protein